MAAEPDHLLWKCLCCEDSARSASRSLSLSLNVLPLLSRYLKHTQIFTDNTVRTRMRNAHCLFPLSPHPTPPPSASPASVSQQTGRAGGRLSCRSRPIMWKRWHIFWKRGRFRSGKHKQRCFNMMAAGGTQRKVKEGNKGTKKHLTIQYKPLELSPGVLKCVSGAWRRRRSYRYDMFFLLYLTSF